MITLENLFKLTNRHCINETYPIFRHVLFPDDHWFRSYLGKNYDQLYDFQHQTYEKLANEPFANESDYNRYHDEISYEDNTTDSTILIFLKLMISFRIISFWFYWRINKETRESLSALFEAIQSNCDKKKLRNIREDLHAIFDKDMLLNRYKNFILYQNPIFKTYKKTNKSKHPQELLDYLISLPRDRIDYYAKKHASVPFIDRDTNDDGTPIIDYSKPLKARWIDFDTKSLRNVTYRFKDKILNKIPGVIKVSNKVKFSLAAQWDANYLMQLYWQDELAQSYKNQPCKVAKRLYNLIKRKTHTRLANTKLEHIELIVRESFDLSIYPK